MINVIDNVISSRYQTAIAEMFFNPSCNWNYNPNISGDNNTQQFGLTIQLISNGNNTSQYVDFLLPLVYEISDKSGVNFDRIQEARVFTQPPSTSKYDNDVFHVDIINPHYVFLYYINDSDGDTIVSKNKYENEQSPFLNRNYKEIDVLKKISPKKGKVVVFDGYHYHAAGIPHKSTRSVLNFDVISY